MKVKNENAYHTKVVNFGVYLLRLFKYLRIYGTHLFDIQFVMTNFKIREAIQTILFFSFSNMQSFTNIKLIYMHLNFNYP